jgi:hypothetical protein
MGLRAGLVMVVKRKISSPCQDLNPYKFHSYFAHCAFRIVRLK